MNYKLSLLNICDDICLYVDQYLEFIDKLYFRRTCKRYTDMNIYDLFNTDSCIKYKLNEQILKTKKI